jgi:hypothetical protein
VHARAVETRAYPKALSCFTNLLFFREIVAGSKGLASPDSWFQIQMFVKQRADDYAGTDV